MSERLQMQGHLATVENEIHHLRLRMKTLRDAIRGQLYPMKPVEDIDGGAVLDAAVDLNARGIELAEKLAIKKQLETALGR